MILLLIVSQTFYDKLHLLDFLMSFQIISYPEKILPECMCRDSLNSKTITTCNQNPLRYLFCKLIRHITVHTLELLWWEIGLLLLYLFIEFYDFPRSNTSRLLNNKWCFIITVPTQYLLYSLRYRILTLESN